MRLAILFCLFVLFGYTANAQFSIIPQVGLENSRTSVEFNELSSFTPVSGKLLPQASIRLNYLFKKSHGPYVGLATTRSIVNLQFADPETVVNNYSASIARTQLRLEGGYQVSTRPIYFGKSASTTKTSKTHYRSSAVKSRCGNYVAKAGCCNKSSERMKKSPSSGVAKNTSWVRIQPSLGLAYMPSAPSREIVTKSQGNQAIYQYNAGTVNTALVSGVGFEFGNGKKRNFIVSINYVKGLGNTESTVTTLSGNKPAVTSLESHSSSWSVGIGVPISFATNKSVIKKQLPAQKIYKVEKKCGQSLYQYHKRCNKRT